MLLYPDQQAPQPENDTTCFSAPIDKCDWSYLYNGCKTVEATGMRFAIITDWVFFMRNDMEVTDSVCLVLRDNEDADTCLESAAWIRIKEDYPGMIYIVRGTTSADKWQTHAASLGAPEHTVCMVDLDVNDVEETL